MNAMKKYSEERLLKVLLRPFISEKATMVAEKNGQVMFKVLSDATKPEVKAAVELLFKVQVDSVQIVNRKGKQKRSGRSIGCRRSSRHAFVCLRSGQEINFVEGAK